MNRLVPVLVLALAATRPAHGEPVPLVLGEHEVAVALTAEADLASMAPPSFAPDAWFGVTSRWTVGVIHSDASIDRIGAGAGVCLAAPCANGYRGGGIEARWSLRTGTLAIAPRVRVLVRELAPMEPAVTFGALVRWSRGRFAIASDPYARVGLASVDVNPPAIVLPLWLELQVAARLAVAIHTGWGSSLPVVPDAWHVPLALDLDVRASHQIELTTEVGFTSAFGPSDRGRERSLALCAIWHR